MLNKLVFKCINYIVIDSNYSQEEIEQMNYSLKLIVYEVIKFVLVIAIFSLLGYFKHSILILLVMGFTKPFIGGYHEDTHLKCFLVTSLLVAFIIYCSIECQLDLVSGVGLNLVSLFAIYNRAPVINNKMPLTKDSLIKRNRIIGITSSIIISMVGILNFHNAWFSKIILWTIVVQAMLMFNKRSSK